MKDFKTILALDTAMGGCGVCVYDTQAQDGSNASEPTSYGQGERLMPLISETLANANRQYADIDAVLTTQGPGVFTGLRIGLSTAKSIALALDVPVYGLSTLQALAAGFKSDKPFGVLIETKREEFYVQYFGANRMPLSEPQLARGEDIWTALEDKKTIFIGDSVARFEALAPDAAINLDHTLPDLKAATEFFLNNPAIAVKDPAPIYLREADVSAPKTQGRKIGNQ